MGIHGLPRTKFFRQVAPGGAGPKNPADAVHRLARRHRWPPSRFRLWKTVFDDQPFLVGHFVSWHVGASLRKRVALSLPITDIWERPVSKQSLVRGRVEAHEMPRHADWPIRRRVE